MPCFIVDDIHDPRLSPYRELVKRKPSRRAGQFIAEGDKVTERLIASRYPVASLLLIPEWVRRFEPLVPADTPLYVGSRQLLEATIGFNFHRGVLACGRRLPPLRLEEAIPAGTGGSTVVVCDAIKDPTNLGSTLRTAAAFGVSAVVLGPQCADYLSRRVVRVSMGAALHLPIVETSDLTACIERLRHKFQHELIGTVLSSAAEPLADVVRSARMALLLGGEAHGLAPELASACDRRVTIPMQIGIDSLNVAVAAAVFLFHFCQQLTKS